MHYSNFKLLPSSASVLGPTQQNALVTVHPHPFFFWRKPVEIKIFTIPGTYVWRSLNTGGRMPDAEALDDAAFASTAQDAWPKYPDSQP